MAIFCPYCGSRKFARLPGGVVYQCLNLKCWWPFQKEGCIGIDKPEPEDAQYADERPKAGDVHNVAQEDHTGSCEEDTSSQFKQVMG